MFSKNKLEKVFVAMSGGVDSSVAALLLKKDGYDVTGVHMLCADMAGLKSHRYIEHPDEQSDIGAGVCQQAQEDRRDAARVAAKLDIPFLVWDFREEYRRDVFDHMIGEYRAGKTPNPDVMCNREIKFGVFLKKALANGADYIATGHYVKRSSLSSLATKLMVARDINKDQSYFLWTLTQEQLQHCLFPIGDYLKSEVRELARKFQLPTAEKKDSQGLCFVGKVDFGKFLRGAIIAKPGLAIKKDGSVIGKHDGSEFYTIGQRHGLGIGGSAEPMYVAEKDVCSNTLVLARDASDPILYRKELVASSLHWIAGPPAGGFPFQCLARIRYRQLLQKATLYSDGSPTSIKVVFDNSQRAIAPGQSVVFYEHDIMLGGGMIQ